MQFVTVSGNQMVGQQQQQQPLVIQTAVAADDSLQQVK